MKNSQAIISKILQIQELGAVRPSYESQRLKLFLPESIRKHIIRITSKESRILICFKNHVVCTEFNKYHSKKIIHSIHENPSLFPSILRESIKNYIGDKKNASKNNTPKKNSQITAIGYVPKHLLCKDFPKLITVQIEVYPERSYGNFINAFSKNSPSYDILEEIRSIIKENQAQVHSLKEDEEVV